MRGTRVHGLSVLLTGDSRRERESERTNEWKSYTQIELEVKLSDITFDREYSLFCDCLWQEKTICSHSLVERAPASRLVEMKNEDKQFGSSTKATSAD